MRKFFAHTVTLISEIIILVIAVAWYCSVEDTNRYEPLALGVTAIAGIIGSSLSRRKGDGNKGNVRILKTGDNTGSTIIQGNNNQINPVNNGNNGNPQNRQ
jgi:hypothetical protein